MKFFPLGLFLIAFIANAATPATPPALPLQDGEQLSFEVSWGVLGAGKIKIEAAADTTAKEPRLKVTMHTATRGFPARMLLPFDADATSLFDLKTGKLLSLVEMSEKRKKRSEHSVTFDHEKREALYTIPGNTQPSRTLPFPAGDPVDLIMALLQTRTWDLKEGESRDALVLFDDDFYELTIHAARYETLRTSMGTFKTLVLEPRMDKTPPKGMFKRGSSVRVWISQDAQRLPVKFEVEFNIGTGTATLDAYQPPASARAKMEGKAATSAPSSSGDAQRSRP
jgi:hypothetical protein